MVLFSVIRFFTWPSVRIRSMVLRHMGAEFMYEDITSFREHARTELRRILEAVTVLPPFC